ncbi:ribonuclease R [Oceanospirillum sediminis]|uniref:Ribonuclease R n=1 Tax=Oceanospirillum sediminis TaxID=2760088 RepID=A0A839IKL3_9GAMM|nr:ribonuclease R [Oceanospirillum sediminis]MBB1485250.1 ribonuclease R [Oceanospirillum sediminis]
MKPWSVKQDPHADRESGKYDNPVPSREFIMDWLSNYGRPMTHIQLCERMGLEDDQDIEALRRRLRAMERDGQLLSNRKGAYGLVSRMQLVKGRVEAHADGYGFLIPDDGSDDLFLAAPQMRKVFHEDVVLARVTGTDRKGRREGNIVETLQHNTHKVVGRYLEDNGIAFVRPDNPKIHHDVLIPPGEQLNAEAGQMVSVEITQQPQRRMHVQGKVTEVLGDEMAPGMEIDIAIRQHGIPHEFPQEVLDQIAGMSAQVAEADKERRIDLRHLPFVTIDGEDAKDFDDAVFCEKKRWGSWKLYVAIADVSHYVGVNTPLDHEAHRRGNSVYFPGQVVPMLPELLSNGLCSLNPHVDRLVMVCEMSISAKGQISRYRFCEAVIRSHARLTYTQVGALLDNPEHPDAVIFKQPEYQGLVKDIHTLYDLYKLLRIARGVRGAIDFETTETRIVFDDQRKIERIVPVVRNDAHKLIEECMLCANVASARFLEKYTLPGLFRVHQGPKSQRLDKLKTFLGELGLELGGGLKPAPEDYQTILQAIEGRADAETIQTMLLQSLSQAVYTPQNEGHFGLNYKAYTHFTSPIRRYPDLLLHRAIRALLRSEQESNHLLRAEDAVTEPRSRWLPYSMEQMLELGEHCSMTERRADEATYDVLAWLKCEYISAHLGESFSGKVTGVTGFGLFVRLDEVYVEGLVHVTGLPSDYYQFDAAKARLRGERSGRSFGLGDELNVIVARVDLDDRKVDFELDQSVAVTAGKKRKPRKRQISPEELSLAKSIAEDIARETDKKPKKKKSDRNSRKKKLRPAEKGRSGFKGKRDKTGIKDKVGVKKKNGKKRPAGKKDRKASQ